MTKEEKIKEVWGELMPDYTNIDLNNGWSLDDFHEEDFNDIDFHTQQIYTPCKIRPKSLQGIEDNNGWILGLPTEETDNVWLMTKDAGIVCSNYEYMKGDEAHWIENVTHYQPIVKPKDPIY